MTEAVKDGITVNLVYDGRAAKVMLNQDKVRQIEDCLLYTSKMCIRDSSRVEWCACFVSWCADQCGYIESGLVPKFAGCVDGANSVSYTHLDVYKRQDLVCEA